MCLDQSGGGGGGSGSDTMFMTDLWRCRITVLHLIVGGHVPVDMIPSAVCLCTRPRHSSRRERRGKSQNHRATGSEPADRRREHSAHCIIPAETVHVPCQYRRRAASISKNIRPSGHTDEHHGPDDNEGNAASQVLFTPAKRSTKKVNINLH